MAGTLGSGWGRPPLHGNSDGAPRPTRLSFKSILLDTVLSMMGAGMLYLGHPRCDLRLCAFEADIRAIGLGACSPMLAVMSADAAAYAGGRLLGRRQLAPSVSPNKTMEGAIFGWLGGFGATIALDQILNLDVEIWPLVLLALVLPIVSQLGDLAESLFKRAMDVKDSSNLIPGHGGVLDRLDSLLFGLPVVYFFLQWTT